MERPAQASLCTAHGPTQLTMTEDLRVSSVPKKNFTILGFLEQIHVLIEITHVLYVSYNFLAEHMLMLVE